MPRPRPHLAASLTALLISAIAVLALHALLNRPQAPQNDAIRYLSLAWSIEQHGVFAEARPGEPAPGPQMHYMPLYPALVALALRFDDELRRNVECALRNPDAQLEAGCEPVFTSVVSTQLLLLSIALWIIWLLAFELSGSTRAAWASLVAAALSRWPLEFANTFLLEIPLITLFAVLSLAVVRTLHTGRARWYCLVGATLGVLTLVKAVFLYVTIAFAIGWVLLALALRTRGAGRARRAWVLAPLAFVVVISPWLARNALVLGQPVLSAGYGGDILVQRVAYNDMTPAEWGVAFVYWFPDIGDSIARRAFAPEHYARLQRVGDRSFYVVGNTTLNARTKAEARERGQSQMGYLLREYVLGNLAKHVAVTIPMAWQGLFVAKWWGVLAVACLVATAPRMIRSRRLDFAVVALAPLLVLGIHAFVSVSLPRYNLMLLPLLSVCMGLAATSLGVQICARVTAAGAARRRR
jgi:hypothetical protein